jgi:hypothetical protein
VKTSAGAHSSSVASYSSPPTDSAGIAVRQLRTRFRSFQAEDYAKGPENNQIALRKRRNGVDAPPVTP